MVELNDLWEGPLGGTRSWYDRATPELRTVVEEIADKIIEKGVEPNWAAVQRYLAARFPADQLPTSKAGISDNVRRLVKARTSG